MKEGKDRQNAAVFADEILGQTLSRALHRDQPVGCLNPEEMAALVDGRLQGEQRDRLMHHISACDRCYDIFILSAEMQEDMGKKRIVVFRPLALAASVLLVVLSIVIIYKSGISLKQEEPAYPSSETSGEFRPESMPKKAEAFKAAGDEEEVTTPSEEKPQPLAKQVTGKGADRRDESKYEETRRKRSGARGAKLEEPLQKEMKAKTATKATAEPLAEAVGEKKAAGREGEEKAEQRLQAPPPKAAQAAVGGTQEGEVLDSLDKDEPTWQEVDRLNLQQFPQRKYIPPKEQKHLFNEAINLTNKLGGELSEMQRQAHQKQDYSQIQNYQRRAGPFLNVVVQRGTNYVSPNITYFQQRSKPGSIEYRFYELARFGWYYHGTWYERGGNLAQTLRYLDTRKESEKVDPTDAKASKMGQQPGYPDKRLLGKWKKLQPRLSGIFREIADQTIEYLSQKSEPDKDERR